MKYFNFPACIMVSPWIFGLLISGGTWSVLLGGAVGLLGLSHSFHYIFTVQKDEKL